VDRAWDRLDASQLRSQRPGLNSIAWNLWHITRAEDVGVNRFVADRGQVLDDEGWLDRLGIDIRHQGTGQTAEEATTTTNRLDLEALRGYTKPSSSARGVSSTR
jgi:DinB family protein